MARGRERQVICASCKRYCRRDKAVYIEKVVFSNPIERKDTAEQESYRAVFKREVAYCPGCGKHLRVYEKKKEENQRRREREIERAMQRPVYQDQHHSRKGGYRISEDQQPQEAHHTRATQTQIESTTPAASTPDVEENSELTEEEQQNA